MKHDSRTRDKITNCRGNQDFFRVGLQFDLARYFYRGASYAIVADFALADMNSCRYLDT